MNESDRSYQQPAYPGTFPSGVTYQTPVSPPVGYSTLGPGPSGPSAYGGFYPPGYGTAYPPSGPDYYGPSGYPQAPVHLVDRHFAIMQVRPWVDYALREAQVTSYRHAITESALITYLIGMGYDPTTAHRIVESWEIDELFPGE